MVMPQSPFSAPPWRSRPREGAICHPPLQAEPVEPVAWMCSSPELMAKGYSRFSSRCEGDWNIPVYTAPHQRKPLTKEEILRAFYTAEKTPMSIRHGLSVVESARIVERAHGIKE